MLEALYLTSIVSNCYQRAEAQRGSELHMISNWNGTMELPRYDFGDKVLQEGSFGETPVLQGPHTVYVPYTQARV